jgi:hypothetical protein
MFAETLAANDMLGLSRGIAHVIHPRDLLPDR